MYKISVPIKNCNIIRNDREKTLKELEKLNAKRVFLALGVIPVDEAKRKQELALLKENCKFFKEKGYEVGAWNWTFTLNNNKSFKTMRSIKGTDFKNSMCPTDENFIKFKCEVIKEIAKTDVDIIMFDDDFRFGFYLDAPGCLCEQHIKMINEITGESSTREELEKHITTGSKNKYRDAYLKANGDSLRNFAFKLREALNTVNPKIRMGACACMTSWDIDGTNPYELAKILAGDTKPFVRLIGAPYWATLNAWGNSLQDIIELERMESSWTKNEDIEVMAEGDAWPRPRTRCPANYLEGFDTAIRASGCTDGILKYGIDYFSNADYETGYADFHVRNRNTYSKIDELFSDKSCCGVRVYESINKISDIVMPTAVNNNINIENMFFSKAARTLSFNTIPTVYEGKGVCGIVFDENARNMPLEALENGMYYKKNFYALLAERNNYEY